MPSAGIHGHGTTIAGSGTGFAVAQITNINIDGQEIDVLDISDMESEEKWREFIGGMKNAGTAQLTLVYLRGVYSDVLTFIGVVQVFTVTIPDGSTFVCDGFITGGSLAIPFDDKVTQQCGIKFSGKPVFTPGS